MDIGATEIAHCGPIGYVAQLIISYNFAASTHYYSIG